MDQFSNDNFIVILNFTASSTDFSDVSSFSCYVEISITGVRFSSPPPSKTARNGGFIVSRETLWINRGTMSKNTDFVILSMSQDRREIAEKSPRNRREIAEKSPENRRT